MRVLARLALVLAVCGCYTSAPITPAQLVPGKEVGVQLSLTGTDQLARYLGPNVERVNGILIVATDTALELGVRVLIMHGGMEQYWNGETVTIPRADVAALSNREFSWLKTGLLSGILIVAFASLNAAGVIGGGSSNGNGSHNTQ